MKQYQRIDFEHKIIAALLFLPFILALGVRHWLSGWFLLLLLFAVVRVWAYSAQWLMQDKQTKILIGLGLALFVSTLISNTLAGWTGANIERFEVDLKQLIALLLLVYLFHFKACFKWFFRALPIAAIVLFIETMHIHFTDGTFDVNYGSIIFGDFSALLFYLILFAQKYAKWPTKPIGLVLQIMGLCSAFTTVIMAGSRNGWLVFVVLGVMSLCFFYRRIKLKQAFYIAVSALVAIVVVIQSDGDAFIKKRLTQAYNDVASYVQKPHTYEQTTRGSLDYRLAQWNAAMSVFDNKLWFGYGAGGTGLAINKAVDRKQAPLYLRVDDAINRPAHIHNGYLTTLLDKGLIGLALKLGFLLFILWVFWRSRHHDKHTAMLGMILSVAYLTFALSEVPFIRNNHTAIFFLSLAVIWHSRSKSNIDVNNKRFMSFEK